MEQEGVLKQTIRDFSKQVDIVQTIILFLVAFLTPTFLGQLLTLIFGAESVIATNSQLIIGSIVNAALVITATNLKGFWKIAGIVTMPSISAVLGGYVFHTASVFAVYMIPAITWTNPYGPFVRRDYGKRGQTSKPEWGINISKKNLPILSNYTSDKYFSR